MKNLIHYAKSNNFAICTGDIDNTESFFQIYQKLVVYLEGVEKKSIILLLDGSYVSAAILMACLSSDITTHAYSSDLSLEELKSEIKLFQPGAILMLQAKQFLYFNISKNFKDKILIKQFVLFINSGKQKEGFNAIEIHKYQLISRTSGSTGNPKYLCLSNKTKMARANSLIESLSLHNYERFLISSGFQQTLSIRFLISALLIGKEICLLNSFAPNEWITQNAKRNSLAPLVPPQLRRLLVSAGEPITKRGDVLLSSSFCQVREKAEAIKNICRNLFECYGTAEVAIATIIQHDEESLNTVGKEITGVSVETKLASTPSEIMVKSSFIADRIYDTKDGKILKHPIGNWFETGDLGILIDGNLVFLGRLNDRISVGGMKVFPAEVEKVLMEMPNIKECLVFSVPNVNLEETVGVGVVFAKEAMNISQIQNYCLDKLEPYKIPQLVLMLDSIPLSNGGKPDRQQLTKLAIKNVKFKKET